MTAAPTLAPERVRQLPVRPGGGGLKYGVCKRDWTRQQALVRTDCKQRKSCARLEVPVPLNLLVADLLRHARRLKSREAGPCGPRADMGRPGALERALIPPAAPSEAAESIHISPSQMSQSPVRHSMDGQTGGNDGKSHPTESDTGHGNHRSFTPQFGALPQLSQRQSCFRRPPV